MCDHIKDPLDEYEARSFGRFGNQLFDYIFMRLLSIQHGSTLINDIDFPKPFNVPKGQFHLKQRNIGLNYRECIPEYPMDFKYFKNNMPLIKSFFKIPKMEKRYDIVIHIRLDDALKPSETLYTILPFSFYEKVLSSIKNKHGSLVNSKILCVARPINAAQNKIFGDIVLHVSELTGAEVTVQSGSVSEDIQAIMSASIVIGSIGSFWIWPALLSNITKEIYMPIFGQNKVYKITSNQTIGGKRIYPIKVGLAKKITIKNLSRMYDTKNSKNFLNTSITRIRSNTNRPSKAKITKYKKLKKLPYSIAFIGIARNVEKDIGKTLKNIDKMNAMFSGPNYFIAYENDSDDKTLEILNNYKFNGSKILIAEQGAHKSYKKRTERIAHARNVVLDSIAKLKDNGVTFDFIINIDLDDVNHSINLLEFYKSFDPELLNKWSVLTANQIEYYDYWALRTKDYDRNIFAKGNYLEEDLLGRYFKDIPDWKTFYSDLQTVISAFGGLAIYKYNVVFPKSSKYCLYDSDKGTDCEHVLYHKCLLRSSKDNGKPVRIVINPKLLNAGHYGDKIVYHPYVPKA
jgi:hypothetical protein